MRKISVCGLLAVVALMAAVERAYAQLPPPVSVDCSTDPGALIAHINSIMPGGTNFTFFVITGPCDGNFTFIQNNIRIDGLVGSQTINGGVFIKEATNIEFNSITFQNAPGDAIFVDGPGRVNIGSSTIQNSVGVGLHASHGAVIVAGDVTVAGNTGVGALAEAGSTVDFEGGSISQSGAPNEAAVVAQDSSNVRLLFGATVTGPTNNHAILVSRGSSALIQGSTITASIPFSVDSALAVVTAEQGSAIRLAGGNGITNNAAGGAAVLVRSGSTLVEDNGTAEGFMAAADTVNGDGRVSTQSVIELGAAQAGGGGITWNGNINLSQASSFIADGNNVTLSGTLALGQAASAYFNHSKGTSNNVGQVTCKSTTDHVSNPTLVTPNVTIGLPPGCARF